MRLPRLIPLRRSRRLSFFLVALHALALLSFCLLFSWAWLAGSVATSVLLVSLFYCLRDSTITALRLGRHGDIFCLFADGSRAQVAVMPSTIVFSGLIVLRLYGDGGATVLSLLSDNFVAAADFRVLKVWLRSRAAIFEQDAGDEV